MPGSVSGGRKAAATNKEKYGEDFYKKMGKKGGSTPTSKPKGFATNPELARTAGAKGGSISRRGPSKNKTTKKTVTKPAAKPVAEPRVEELVKKTLWGKIFGGKK